MDDLNAAAHNLDVIKGYEIWVGAKYDKYTWGAGAGGFEKKTHTTDKYKGNNWDVQTLTDPLFRTMSTCYEGAPGRALREFEDRMSSLKVSHYESLYFSKERFEYLQDFIRESEDAFIPIANLRPTTAALKSFQVLASAILELRTATYSSFYDIIKDAFAEVRDLMGFTCDDSGFCGAPSGTSGTIDSSTSDEESSVAIDSSSSDGESSGTSDSSTSDEESSGLLSSVEESKQLSREDDPMSNFKIYSSSDDSSDDSFDDSSEVVDLTKSNSSDDSSEVVDLTGFCESLRLLF